MERAVLKTLIYADIFDYPLKVWEIHKWLVGKQTILREVEKALDKLVKKSRVDYQDGYFFLKGRKRIVQKRLGKSKPSSAYFRKARLVAIIFKLIPWVKLVGISGGLAMENAGKEDDIDLFIVTAQGKIWVSRLLMLTILSALGLRRLPNDSKKEAAGKICLNLILEQNKLEQKRKDLYMAHEILQMKVLWQRNGIYHDYLDANFWVFKFLPNWSAMLERNKQTKTKDLNNGLLERYAKSFQENIMGKPKGDERIEEGALYFHPQNYGDFVKVSFRKRLDKIA